MTYLTHKALHCAFIGIPALLIVVNLIGVAVLGWLAIETLNLLAQIAFMGCYWVYFKDHFEKCNE